MIRDSDINRVDCVDEVCRSLIFKNSKQQKLNDDFDVISRGFFIYFFGRCCHRLVFCFEWVEPPHDAGARLTHRLLPRNFNQCEAIKMDILAESVFLVRFSYKGNDIQWHPASGKNKRVRLSTWSDSFTIDVSLILLLSLCVHKTHVVARCSCTHIFASVSRFQLPQEIDEEEMRNIMSITNVRLTSGQHVTRNVSIVARGMRMSDAQKSQNSNQNYDRIELQFFASFLHAFIVLET